MKHYTFDTSTAWTGRIKENIRKDKILHFPFFSYYWFVVSHDHFKGDLCNSYLSWKQIHSLGGWTTWGEINFSEAYPQKAAINYCYKFAMEMALLLHGEYDKI